MIPVYSGSSFTKIFPLKVYESYFPLQKMVWSLLAQRWSELTLLTTGSTLYVNIEGF